MMSALELQIDRLENELREARNQNIRNEETIDNLREFERLMPEYRQVKRRFDEMITRGDPDGYIAFFEFISPENADRLYAEALVGRQYTRDVRSMANVYSEMSPSDAAAALEAMLVTDTELVVGIARNLSTRDLAFIMEEMEVANRAVLTRLLYPDEPQVTDTVIEYAPVLPDLPPPVIMPDPVAEDEETEEIENGENGENGVNGEINPDIPAPETLPEDEE